MKKNKNTNKSVVKAAINIRSFHHNDLKIDKNQEFSVSLLHEDCNVFSLIRIWTSNY